MEDIPFALVNQQLIEGGTARLMRSFSRRLNYLHDHPEAVAICKRWLQKDGLLGNAATLNELGLAMFINIAPVYQEGTLAALERAIEVDVALPHDLVRSHTRTLRLLAHEPKFFERCVRLLTHIAMQLADDAAAEAASKTLASLFTIHLSGTHASAKQRSDVIEQLLLSSDEEAQNLGIEALGQMLKAWYFTSFDLFEFGARSRDHGSSPKTIADVLDWYGIALALVGRFVKREGAVSDELRQIVAGSFRALWSSASVCETLDTLIREIAAKGFWQDGWTACRETLYFDGAGLPADSLERLRALEAALRPTGVADTVRGCVLGDALDLDEADGKGDSAEALKRQEAKARELGSEVAADHQVFVDLLPDVLRGGIHVWPFGRGLAASSTDVRATWAQLVSGFESVPTSQRDPTVLRGYLVEVWENDRELCHQLLDTALEQPVLQSFLPALQTAVGLDDRGIERLVKSIRADVSPIWQFRQLTFGGVTSSANAQGLKAMLLCLADQPAGCEVAVEILNMRIFSDNSAGRKHETAIVEAGRALLERVDFRDSKPQFEHAITEVVTACIQSEDSAPAVEAIMKRLTETVGPYSEVRWHSQGPLLRTLLTTHPLIVLDALFAPSLAEGELRSFRYGDWLHGNPFKVVAPDVLVAWCDADPSTRYAFAASVIEFGRAVEPDKRWDWTEQAIALLTRASDQKSVLAEFVERFRPSSWSGSRAAIMETNAQLLDRVETQLSPEALEYARSAKRQLIDDIATEKASEERYFRKEDETFE